MSISNLSLRGKLLTLTSVASTAFTLPLNAQIAPQTIVPSSGPTPAGKAPYYKVIVSGTKSGGAIVLGAVQQIAAYPGNAAGVAPVYPLGFSVDLTGTNLIFVSDVGDISTYVFTLY